MKELEEIFLDITKLNNSITDKERVEVLLRSLPKYLDFIELMTEANNIDQDPIYTLLEFKMKQRKAHSQPISLDDLVLPTARLTIQQFQKNSKKSPGIPSWNSGKINYKRDEYRNLIREKKISKTLYLSANISKEFSNILKKNCSM